MIDPKQILFGICLMTVLSKAPLLAADNPESSGQNRLPPIMHIDPLDAGRASAMHRGPNPHADLTPEQHMQVAAQHMAAGRSPQALAVLTQALAKYPGDDRLYAMRAALELEQQDIKGALADMEQALRMAPDNPLYRISRAQLYLRFERKEEALEDLNRAVELNPDLVAARFNRGSLLANLGREKEALEDFDRCIAIEPELPAPWFNRGSMHWALGERTQARADIHRFIELADEPAWKKAGEDLLRVWDEQEQNPSPTSVSGS
ncbi:tetratricopeptide repeat protein [Thiolapillus sp.]